MKKTVLITGGSKGIGRSVVLKFASLGYNVVFSYNSSKEGADEVIRSNKNPDAKILCFKCDVSKEEECKNLVLKTIEKFQTIDILINNAGVLIGGKITEIASEDLQKEFAVNVFGNVYMIKHSVKHFNKEGGSIINISSIVADSPFPNILTYSATKSAVSNLTVGIARELSGTKIRVNAIAPGGIDTEMGSSVDESTRKQINAQTSLEHRIGKPEEIANAIYLLTLPESYWVHGQVITVDGGYTSIV